MYEYMYWLRSFFNWLPYDPELPGYGLAARLHLWFEYGPLSLLRARWWLRRMISRGVT